MISLLLKRWLQRRQKGFIQMINTLTRAATLGALLATTIFATAAPSFAQAPSQAQRDAIKSQCRSDYMAHCSSIPPGGEASLQCLQKNMSSLSSACQGAVRAVQAPAAAAPARRPRPSAAAAAQKCFARSRQAAPAIARRAESAGPPMQTNAGASCPGPCCSSEFQPRLDSNNPLAVEPETAKDAAMNLVLLL